VYRKDTKAKIIESVAGRLRRVGRTGNTFPILIERANGKMFYCETNEALSKQLIEFYLQIGASGDSLNIRATFSSRTQRSVFAAKLARILPSFPGRTLPTVEGGQSWKIKMSVHGKLSNRNG
jgi:hypothetical protein